MQNTNWNRETGKTVACILEKREEILSFPKFQVWQKRNVELRN
ncbi:hypothetical protein LEP1GSC034_3831 [Leptospira interrogans str. 2003000735]|uniref:Uncharacterized protein n=1 Tax=Leptospira interrogans str. 2002000626 TaxID=996803 RepID=A0A829D8Z8_LEPIR|nr:hypothetical protein LEP1GSC027_2907 [Leptospira interrogans str. 2002000624]EKQ39109.1 hypothetical protein LEP1GSC025_1006 [Leptospira interrogans str. 2002000621]EKQ46393.1 hypothetical protein LEP1GSC026_1165 [Leptospira interrogans str. 2002000623]EMJ72593.1 hypothetical protein LEP1GSC034_3831 [Leptospira interrogans str. 2003000735]EMJ75859.1 hypothetical protein LEP1GSC033_3058 [Leptospira interrogans str. 2002000632]EMJ85268.1 hypothetical protein LEP1GSC032_0380 [Leptospira interr